MEQAETIKFLSSGHAFAADAPVEVIETHGAYVFLCGDIALELKRAVKNDYMDLSTAALRRSLIARELELNQPAAPEIYRDMLPVAQSETGLALNGDGPVVEWVLRMWRFPAENELERVADLDALDDPLAIAVGEAIADYHAAAPVRQRPGRNLIADILAELGRVFAEFPGAAGASRLVSRPTGRFWTAAPGMAMCAAPTGTSTCATSSLSTSGRFCVTLWNSMKRSEPATYFVTSPTSSWTCVTAIFVGRDAGCWIEPPRVFRRLFTPLHAT